MKTSLVLLPAVVTATSLAASAPAWAQADPKFEYGKADELKDVKDVEWNATAEAGVVFTTGNSRTTTLTGSVKAMRKEKKNKLSLEATGTFARASTLVVTGGDMVASADELDYTSKTSAKNAAGKLRYDRFLTEWDALFVAALAGLDPIAGKDFVGGGQLGYARVLYKTEKHAVNLEGGYDFTYENFVTGAVDSVSIHSARGFVGYEGVLTETTKLAGSLEVLANLNETAVASAFEDIRSLAKAELSTKITDDISLSVSFQAKHDNAPGAAALPAGYTADPANPPLAEKLDTTTKASLIVTLL